jgi:serine/threonine-protein kinase
MVEAKQQSVEQAALLLIQQRRFSEAGQLLLKDLGVRPEDVGRLDAGRRKLAFQAAVCFVRSGAAETASKLFFGLGEHERALEVLQKAREAGSRSVGSMPAQPASSGDVAQEPVEEQTLEPDALVLLDDPSKPPVSAPGATFLEIAEKLSRRGKPIEAAEAFARAGEIPRALESALRIPRDDPRYREACVLAVRFASALDELSFTIDRYLEAFLAVPPANPAECGAFFEAAQLYTSQDHFTSAQDVYRQLLSVAPDHPGAREGLEALEAAERESGRFERVLEQEEEFRRASSDRAMVPEAASPLPDLPDLPELLSRPLDPRAETVSLRGSGHRSAHASESTSTMAGGRRDSTRSERASSRPSSSETSLPEAEALDRDLPPGSVVAGRYRVEEKIGEGGMSAVYRVADLELGEQIALKLFTQPLTDETLVARFKQELTLSRQLQHPNIIRLYDIASVRGHRILTMELLNGSDLRSKIDNPLPIGEGIGYLLQCCAALGHAHSKGVVHRDVKPANIFLTTDGVIKLMDFGIAKRQDAPGLTVSGTIAGTPEYMSPEQISGFERVAASTDLYALGIMAYRFFTGTVPFQHEEIMPLLMMQATAVPEEPLARNPEIPIELNAIILKLLEKDPANRFPTAESVAEALQSVPC